MQKTIYFFTLMLLSGIMARAQSAADSTIKSSPARTLTYQHYQAYLKGEADDEMARVAEMNHYPMPDKVLKWKKELDLSPIQIQKITEIKNYMHRRRLQTGGSIIANERTLDSLFRHNKIDDGTVIFYGNRSGAYLGELRNAMLLACLSTQKLLSPQQNTRYEALQKPN
ncbi:hypothetical protein [Mucilaginibacter sp.]|uniref:hypothetical protein n=1 Tax=Mucilaginibacter sp. TaxID=1882438 RepID=UPI0026397480|nr:hypothetical protein [Mucilaginibacter sp.]MDB4926833.1 hypothetical protein [Mucilaginibacter sp.]